jgi:hypothetical protein
VIAKDAKMLQARARRLIGAANEMLSIARELERVAAQDESHPLPDPGPRYRDVMAEDQPYFLDLAQRAYADRRRREKLFPGDLFGEPAWDILLDLFVNAKNGKRVSVSSACIGAAVPTTTALRWVAVLEAQGHIVREDDPRDARRAFLHLSAEAYARMLDYFSAETAGLGALVTENS